MKNARMFFLNLIMAMIRFGLLLIVSLVLILIGAVSKNGCLDVGIAFLILYSLLCLVPTIRIQRSVASLSADDPEFGDLIDQIMGDPHGFLKESMEEQEKKQNLHGVELLELSDDDLHETVWFQNLSISENAEDSELDLFTGPRRTVYILDLFDSEVQNGGLCQFFVNSSREAAPFVSDCLKCVGAFEHQALFDDFVLVNGIELSDLSSFQTASRRCFIKQTKRFDFDAFDERYYELPALQEKIVAYIRDNITEF